MVNVIVFYVFLILTCTIALRKGGGPERAVAICWLVAVAANQAVTIVPRVFFAQVEIGILVVDVLLLIALGAVALSANRFWTLWESSMQLVVVAAHGAKAYQTQIDPWMYHAVVAWTSYPMLALMVVGTVRHQRRLRQTGTDPAWRPFLRPSSMSRIA